MKTLYTLLFLSILNINPFFNQAKASNENFGFCQRLSWEPTEKTFSKSRSKMIKEAKINYAKNEIFIRANITLIDHSMFTIFATERYDMSFKGRPTDSITQTKIINGKRYISRNFTFISLSKSEKIAEIDRYQTKFTMAVTYTLDQTGNAITFDDFVYTGKNKIKKNATLSFDMLTKEGTNADRYYNTDDYDYSKWFINIDRTSNFENDTIRYHLTYPIGKLENFSSIICTR